MQSPNSLSLYPPSSAISPCSPLVLTAPSSRRSSSSRRAHSSTSRRRPPSAVPACVRARGAFVMRVRAWSRNNVNTERAAAAFSGLRAAKSRAQARPPGRAGAARPVRDGACGRHCVRRPTTSSSPWRARRRVVVPFPLFLGLFVRPARPGPPCLAAAACSPSSPPGAPSTAVSPCVCVREEAQGPRARRWWWRTKRPPSRSFPPPFALARCAGWRAGQLPAAARPAPLACVLAAPGRRQQGGGRRSPTPAALADWGMGRLS